MWARLLSKDTPCNPHTVNSAACTRSSPTGIEQGLTSWPRCVGRGWPLMACDGAEHLRVACVYNLRCTDVGSRVRCKVVTCLEFLSTCLKNWKCDK